MDSLALANHITEIIVDRQGEDILLLDITDIAAFADYFIICSGTSRRQLDALQGAIREELKRADERILAKNVEGEPDSGWILMDFSGVIVHLFDPEMRDYYRLEDLWRNARVVARIQ